MNKVLWIICFIVWTIAFIGWIVALWKSKKYNKQIYTMGIFYCDECNLYRDDFSITYMILRKVE